MLAAGPLVLQSMHVCVLACLILFIARDGLFHVQPGKSFRSFVSARH